jgi:signal transduction histidine kinase
LKPIDSRKPQAGTGLAVPLPELPEPGRSLTAGAESLLRGHIRVLELIARGSALTPMLEAVIGLVESQTDALASILFLEPDGRLRVGPAPHLPPAYTRQVDGLPIGPQAGSCGTAAYRRQLVIVSDIATDPLWQGSAQVPISFGFHACWSRPIMSADGAVLGTLAMYYRESRRPSPFELDVVEAAAHLAGIAIERMASEEVITRANAALEQRVAERTRELTAANVKYRALLDALPDPILRLDRCGVIREYRSAKGYEQLILATELLGRSLSDVLPPPLASLCMRHLQQALAHGGLERLEYASSVREETRQFEARIMPLSGEEAVAIIRDISDRRRAEERERYLQAELTHVVRLSTMGEMASNLAHELNQPLSAIVAFVAGCARRLEEGDSPTPELIAAMREAESEALRAGDIIRHLREFVRRKEPHQAPVQVNEVVLEVLSLLGPELRLGEVEVKTSLAPHLPVVLADRVQIAQVLINLVRNASEAMASMPRNDRRLRIRTEAAPERRIQVVVEDSGPGFKPGVADRLFEPFNTTKDQGMGMGLAISRAIVQAHGGTIAARPSPGPTGAILSFVLPENPGE